MVVALRISSRKIAVHAVCSQVTNRGKVTIRWTLNHEGAEGNEQADIWAKAAAEGRIYVSD